MPINDKDLRAQQTVSRRRDDWPQANRPAMNATRQHDASRLYFIVRSEMLDGGVIEAQVVARLRAQATLLTDTSIKLLFLEPARVAFGAKARRTLRGYRAMWPEGDIAVVPFVSRFGERGVGRALALYIARERFSSRPLIFHCRGAAATVTAHHARGLLGRGRVVFDLRGAGPYETAHRFGFPFADDLSAAAECSYRETLAQEREAASVSDFLLTVSHPMRDYAVRMLSASADKIRVTPSSVEGLTFDTGRRGYVRRKWGVSDSAPVFVYSGRLGPERLPDHMFRLFARVLEQRPDALLVLLVYRYDFEDLDARLASHRVSAARVITANCSRDEVMDYLSGADVGIFFCEPALRFEVALPIKFAEYVSAGLSLVANSVATEVAEIVRSRRLGWIIDDGLVPRELDVAVRQMLCEIDAGRLEARARALACCSDLFLSTRQVPAIRHAYGLLSTVPPAESLSAQAAGISKPVAF